MTDPRTCSAPERGQRCNSKNVYSVVKVKKENGTKEIYYCLEHHSQRVFLSSRLPKNPDESWTVLKEEPLVKSTY